ncbi:MAG: heptosyltransferase [Pseudomonadota bacterium]|nr:heptosyltransferase [Pseudomonadota bacterium]
MKNKLPLASAPKKICILRLSALGDVMHVIPVVRAIQKHWPGTQITWICGKFEYKLLSAIEGVRFIVLDKKSGWKSCLELRRELKGEVFDVLLHMQVALRANLASLCVRARIRLGWDRSRSRDLHQLFINHSIASAAQEHQVQGFLSFVRKLGIEVDLPVWDFPVSEDALLFAGKYIDEDKKTLLISPCSSHVLRNWDAERYAEVADFAIEKLGMQVILSGGPSDMEKQMASAIEARLRNRVTNLVGKDTLQQLVGLLKSVDVVISPDSGPVHIANALGTPVIGLYACTNSQRSGPYNSLNYCVDKFEVAAKMFRRKPAGQLRWGSKIEEKGVMKLIQTEEVIGKLKEFASKG